MIARLDHPLTVADLGRHFRAVAGTTPLPWLLTQRIRHAQELLETTDDSIDAIAAAAGMGTATTLRRRVNRTVGVPPDTYRRTLRSRTRFGPHDGGQGSSRGGPVRQGRPAACFGSVR